MKPLIPNNIIRERGIVTPKMYKTIGDSGVSRTIKAVKDKAYNLAKKLGWGKYSEYEIHSPHNFILLNLPTPYPVDKDWKTILPAYSYEYQIVLERNDQTD